MRASHTLPYGGVPHVLLQEKSLLLKDPATKRYTTRDARTYAAVRCTRRAGLAVGVTEGLLCAATCYCGCGGTSPSERAARTQRVPDCLFTAKRCTSTGQVTALNQLITMLSQLRYTQRLWLMDLD